MKWKARLRLFVVLQSVAIMTLIFTGTALAAGAISLPASEPATIYYTTSGAEPIVTPPAATTTYTNYYVAEGAKITPPTVVPASETISLASDAGKRGHYARPRKMKAHESKREFEKHIKDKHGKRYKVMDLDAKQSESGPEGYIFLVENKDPDLLQLGDICTTVERAKRIAAVKDFILNNPELTGITENEELRARGIELQCRNLYFDRYINGYEFIGSVFRFSFDPQWNYSFSIHLKPITPEMYAAAQADALPPEEIAKIVYQDLGIPVNGKNGNKPPKLEMRKYLRSTEPYVYWKVSYENAYEINALTGEIVRKRPNVVY